MTQRKIEISVENLDKAFSSLKEFLAEPVLTRRDRAGVIQAFEYSFEQFWKVFKKIADFENIPVASPRQAIQSAFQLGIISAEDEETWADIIKTRNETSHTYNEQQAVTAANKIAGPYLTAFERAWSAVTLKISK